MPFLVAHSGVLRPEEFHVVRNVYDQIVSEPWVSKDPDVQEQFARFVLAMYGRGLCQPEKLFEVCMVAARQKLMAAPIGSLPIQASVGQ